MNDFFNTFANLSSSKKDVEKTNFTYKGTDIIEKAYQIGTYLGLLPQVEFQEFITQGWILERHNSTSLYDINVEEKQKIEILQEHLKEFALKKNRAFVIDWKWSASDVIYNISKIIPELQLEVAAEHFNDTNDSWEVTFDHQGTKVVKEFEFNSLPELIEYINEHLSKTNNPLNIYLAYELSDQYFFFCLETSKADDAFNSEFFDIER